MQKQLTNVLQNSCLRCSRSQMFFKIGVLKNFVIFTGKYLCWSLFLIKLTPKTPKRHFFYETPPEPAQKLGNLGNLGNFFPRFLNQSFGFLLQGKIENWKIKKLGITFPRFPTFPSFRFPTFSFFFLIFFPFFVNVFFKFFNLHL